MTQKNSDNYSDRARHLLNRTAHDVSHHGVSVAVRIVLGLLFLIIIGSVVLMLPGMATEGRLTFAEATFTATSALTVTGLSIIVPATDLTLMGKIVLLILIQMGGVGFMFVAVVLLQLLGRKVLLQDRLALTSSLGLDSPGTILAVLKHVFIGVILIELIGALLLWFRWLRFFPPLKALGFAVFHSISAFCNAGFDLFTGSTDASGTPFIGIPTDSYSLAVMGGLILIGGLGIPVIAELLNFRSQRKRFSLNTRITLYVVAGLTLVGWVGLFISEAVGGGVLAHAPLGEQLVRTLFQSISNRTAGFAGLPAFDLFKPASALIIMAMMFVGCAPASMGGGITTGTFSVLLVSLTSYVRGQPQPVLWKRTIDPAMIQRAGSIFTISIVLLMITTWLILLSHPGMAFEAAMFEVFSAFATCGLSLGVTGELNWFGRIIIMVLMFWGRLGPLTVVMAVAQRRRDQRHLIRYPEEQILIG